MPEQEMLDCELRVFVLFCLGQSSLQLEKCEAKSTLPRVQLMLKDRPAEPALQSCVFPARTNPIVSKIGHVTELDQPSLGPLSNWPVAPKASLRSYLECLFCSWMLAKGPV